MRTIADYPRSIKQTKPAPWAGSFVPNVTALALVTNDIPTRVTDIAQLVPGMEIRFSTQRFISYLTAIYDPMTATPAKHAPKAGTMRRGIVLEVTKNNGVLVNITTGRERGRKHWVPLARVWSTTGKYVAKVPDPAKLKWAKQDRKWQERQKQRERQ